MAKRRAKPEPPANPWPARVQALLDRYSLSHSQLGQRLGVSRANIGDFTNGRRNPPRPVQKLIVMMEDGNELLDVENI